MIKIKNEYKADNGKQFILQIVPRKEEHMKMGAYLAIMYRAVI